MITTITKVQRLLANESPEIPQKPKLTASSGNLLLRIHIVQADSGNDTAHSSYCLKFYNKPGTT